MRTYPKYCNKGRNGICYLILILQLQEIVFSREKNPSDHSDIYFNNMLFKRKNTQKHLGLHLDAQLRFSKHINEKTKKRSNVLV